VVSVEADEATMLEAFFTNHFIEVVIIRYCLNAKMSSMKPVLAYDTLQHHVIHRIIWIRIRSGASAVESSEVVVVAVLVQRVLVGTQHASHHPGELAVSAVTAEVPLCVQFGELVTIVAGETASEAYTGRLTIICDARGTCIQCLALHVALVQNTYTHRHNHFTCTIQPS